MTRKPFEPRWNFYRCGECAMYYVTVEIDPGTTPAALRCRNEGCKGRMHSAGHPRVENWPRTTPREAMGVWYRPGETEKRVMKKKAPMLHRHVLDGGLVQRPPGPNDPTFPESTGGGYGYS